MEDSTLLILALATALLGLSLLYFISSGSPLQEVPIEQVTEDYIGRVVKVKGVVQDWKEYSRSYLITIENGTSIDVFAQKDFIQEGLKLGSLLVVNGEIKDYEGNLEIIPAGAEDISIEKFDLDLVEICELDLYLDRVVRIKGNVVDVKSISTGVLLTVEDSGCAVLVPVFFPVNLENERIEVVGVVKLYRGNLEIVPKTTEDINVQIGQIT